MYYLTPAELNIAAGFIFGATGGLALVLVPALWRALALALFGWVAWRLFQVGPQLFALELLGFVRWMGVERAFLQGAVTGKAVVTLTAFLLRRRAR